MTSTPAAALFGTMASSPMAGGADGAKGQGVPGMFAAVLGGQMTGDANGMPVMTPGGLPLGGAECEGGKGEGGKGNPALGAGLGVSALLAADAMPQAAVPVLNPKFGEGAAEGAAAGTADAEGLVEGALADGELPANPAVVVGGPKTTDGLPVTAGAKTKAGKPGDVAAAGGLAGDGAAGEILAAAEGAQGKVNAKGVGKGLEAKPGKGSDAVRGHVSGEEGDGEEASADAEATAQTVQADVQANQAVAAEVAQASRSHRTEALDAAKGQDVKAALEEAKQSGAVQPADIAGKQWGKDDKGTDGTAIAGAAVADGKGEAATAQHAGHGRAEGGDFSALISGQGEVQRGTSAQAADKAAATPPAQHPTISAQPGKIGRELGVEIARHMQDGTDQLTVRLDPGHHGQIEVTMQFDENGQLRATVTASQSATLEMLRRDSNDLVRSLSDAGVSADAQSFQFDSRGQGSQQGQQQRASGFGRGGNGLNDLGASVAHIDEPQYRPLVGGGRVNMVA